MSAHRRAPSTPQSRAQFDPTLGIIALVPDRWDGIVTVRHHVLRRLAKYHPIVWVEPAANWREFLRPTSAHFLSRDRWSQPIQDVDVFAAGFKHPAFHRPARLARANLRSRLLEARKRLLARGAERIALYIWRDEFGEAIEVVPHDFSCYHIDDEYSFSDTEVETSPQELRLLRNVDQVIVHSDALLEKKGGVNRNTVLIPNGVDFASFSMPRAEPADLAAIRHPRIGYAGMIKRQLDLALLLRIARARPEWSIVMVGPLGQVKGKEDIIAALQQMSNVHFLGRKAASDLPAYVQHFDVCLMCYELNAYTRYIYPLKMHEYLAGGRPAVASAVPAVERFADVVAIARTDEEWLKEIASALSQSDPNDLRVAERRAAARSNDWEELVGRIASLFRRRNEDQDDNTLSVLSSQRQ